VSLDFFLVLSGAAVASIVNNPTMQHQGGFATALMLFQQMLDNVFLITSSG
jgi:hypothetical protein